jgi:hypothetical protein
MLLKSIRRRCSEGKVPHRPPGPIVVVVVATVYHLAPLSQCLATFWVGFLRVAHGCDDQGDFLALEPGYLLAGDCVGVSYAWLMSRADFLRVDDGYDILDDCPTF